jgi:hypothetical protein
MRKSVELTSVLETFPRERLRLQFNDVSLSSSSRVHTLVGIVDLCIWFGAAWY